MHELPVVTRLLDIALEKGAEARVRKIVALDIVVGELCDGQPLWMARYFGLAARGTIAEGAELRFTTEKASADCRRCGTVFAPEVRARKTIRCPECGGDDCELIGGLEYRLERMEAL